MKKTIILISFLVLFVLVGCDGTNGSRPNNPQDTPSPPSDNTETPDLSDDDSDSPKVPTDEPEIVYTIQFFNHQGSLLSTQQVEEGRIPNHTFVAESTSQYQKTFLGWSDEPDGELLANLLPASSDKAYFAVVVKELKTYTVTLDDGQGNLTTIAIKYGEQLETPDSPIREGYQFQGWSSAPSVKQTIQWPLTVTQDTTLYAYWEEVRPYIGILEDLLTLLDFPLGRNPHVSGIPNNIGIQLVDETQIVTDFTTSIEVNSMMHANRGEQWQMVMFNIDQTILFYNQIEKVQLLAPTILSAFNLYLQQTIDEDISYQFTEGIYSVNISYEDEVMTLIIDFTADIPGLGVQTAQLLFEYKSDVTELSGRIQLGEPNVIKFRVTLDEYTFALKYLGIRRSYFHLERDRQLNIISGTIVEYLGLDDSIFGTSSEAFFEVHPNYVFVIGNKASGMIGFEGTIFEAYNRSTERLLGFKVNESVSGLNFDTLWFNIDELSGLTHIRVEDIAHGNNPHTIYVNQDEAPFARKNVGGLSLKRLSRRFDIELRNQHTFSYQVGNESLIELKVIEVPMLFIQEEFLESLETDLMEVNPSLSSFSFNVPQTTVDLILEHYDRLLTPFNLNKETITVEFIHEFIGSKYTHD